MNRHRGIGRTRLRDRRGDDAAELWLLASCGDDELRLTRGAADGERLTLKSLLVARLPPGRLPALGNRQAEFEVNFLGVLPDFATWRTTRGSQGFDARTFEVKARPVKPIEGARPGMSVIVEGAAGAGA